MESRHHLKVVKSSLSPKGFWLSLSVWKWRGREGEEWQSHPESEWDGRTRHAQFPFLPPSLSAEIIPHSRRRRANGFSLSLSLCPNLHRSCDINSANHLRSAEEEEEGAASECSADGATQAAQGC